MCIPHKGIPFYNHFIFANSFGCKDMYLISGIHCHHEWNKQYAVETCTTLEEGRGWTLFTSAAIDKQSRYNFQVVSRNGPVILMWGNVALVYRTGDRCVCLLHNRIGYLWHSFIEINNFTVEHNILWNTTSMTSFSVSASVSGERLARGK